MHFWEHVWWLVAVWSADLKEIIEAEKRQHSSALTKVKGWNAFISESCCLFWTVHVWAMNKTFFSLKYNESDSSTMTMRAFFFSIQSPSCIFSFLVIQQFVFGCVVHVCLFLFTFESGRMTKPWGKTKLISLLSRCSFCWAVYKKYPVLSMIFRYPLIWVL